MTQNLESSRQDARKFSQLKMPFFMRALISVNNFSLTFLERISDFSLLNYSYSLPWWYLESPDCARRVARTAVLLFIYEFHWFLIHLWIIPEPLPHALNLSEGFLFQKSKNLPHFIICYSSSETYKLFI